MGPKEPPVEHIFCIAGLCAGQVKKLKPSIIEMTVGGAIILRIIQMKYKSGLYSSFTLSGCLYGRP